MTSLILDLKKVRPVSYEYLKILSGLGLSSFSKGPFSQLRFNS